MTATLLEITSSGKHKTLGVQGEGVSMSSMITIWLIVFVVLVIIEIITMGLTTIWFAGGALVATLAAAVHAPLWVQIVLFLPVGCVVIIERVSGVKLIVTPKQ